MPCTRLNDRSELLLLIDSMSPVHEVSPSSTFKPFLGHVRMLNFIVQAICYLKFLVQIWFS